MSSTLRNCVFCGLGIRSAGGQEAPDDLSVCENAACQSELERSRRVNAKPEKAKKK